MSQYLVAIHHRDDFDPASEGEDVRADISALNREMIAAGVRVFVGGLSPADQAVSLRPGADDKVATSQGLYQKTGEHVGGLWVLEAASMDEAREWGRKAAIACRAPVEVRAFL